MTTNMKPELHSQAPDARRSSQDCPVRASGCKDKLLWLGLPCLLCGTFLGWNHPYLLGWTFLWVCPCLHHWLAPLDIPRSLFRLICHCPCCCSAITHQQILGSCRVRECPAAPTAQTALSSFAIWGTASYHQWSIPFSYCSAATGS